MDLLFQRLLFQYLKAPEKPWNPWRFLSEVGGGEESQQSGLLGGCYFTTAIFTSSAGGMEQPCTPPPPPGTGGAQRHETVRLMMRGQCQAADTDPGAQGPLTEPLTPVGICHPQNHRLISESLLGPGQQQSKTQSQLPCPLLHPGPRPSRAHSSLGHKRPADGFLKPLPAHAQSHLLLP